VALRLTHPPIQYLEGAVSGVKLLGRKVEKSFPSSTKINPLTPELNPSAQRCLTFFTGDFAS
jgi:hypothetical protein